MVCACGNQPLEAGVLNGNRDGGDAGQDVVSPGNPEPEADGPVAVTPTGGAGGEVASGGGAGDTGAAGGGVQVSGSSGGRAAGGSLAGSSGTGVAPGTAIGPCDIYAADGSPCVAAHSTVRVLFSAYSGPLYQVRKDDGTIKDIGVGPNGFAAAADQDAFCATSACTISVIYDQSGKGNHLTRAPGGGNKTTPGNEADAEALPATISGHDVYGVHMPPGVGYRNNSTKGIATGDNPETIYMVTSGNYYNGLCCFDYGNAETNSHDNGDGAVEAVYFGNCTIWGKGAGKGPWVMADLENGLWAGNANPYEGNTPISSKYVTAMVKGDRPGLNHWVIKAGDAQSGGLATMFDGPRPSSRFNPMSKEGAIILGTAGDNSNAGQGNFFEGLLTAQFSSDAADAQVQANVVSVYGR